MKEVKFSLDNSTVSLMLGDKVTKDALYGEVRRVVEKDGRALERAVLLPDGMLLRRSQISSVAVDSESSPVEALQSLLDDQPVEMQPSSFEKEAPIKSVPLTRLVGFNTTDVYALDAGGLAQGLYETTFNYRKSHQPREALVLVKATEAWLLVGHFKRKRRVEFLDFMDRLVAQYPGKELHVILDNLSTHKVEQEPWARAHPNVHFHFTPTHASWLNQIEVWFSILTAKALRGASFRSVNQRIAQIDAFIAAYNEEAAPFEWTKVKVAQKTPASKYANFKK